MDSDDLLSIDCIEKCLESIGECDILVHGHDCIEENGAKIKESGGENKKLKALERDIYLPWEFWDKTGTYAWTCYELFSIRLFENLRFCAGIVYEDALFGVLIFAISRKIKVESFVGYSYRLRGNSICNRDLTEETPKRPTPPYIHDISEAFETAFMVSQYHLSYSHTHTCLGLLRFLQSLEVNKYNEEIAKRINKFIATFIQAACFGADTSDPRGIRFLLKHLDKYIKEAGPRQRRAYRYPRYSRFRTKLRGIFKNAELQIRQTRDSLLHKLKN